MVVEDFLDKDGNFKCIKCGACCKMNYAFVAFDKTLKDQAPESYWDQEKCQCKYLDKDNLCSKFETRPAACRFKPSEWISSRDIATFCDKLRNIENLRAKYLAFKKST